MVQRIKQHNGEWVDTPLEKVRKEIKKKHDDKRKSKSLESMTKSELIQLIRDLEELNAH